MLMAKHKVHTFFIFTLPSAPLAIKKIKQIVIFFQNCNNTGFYHIIYRIDYGIPGIIKIIYNIFFRGKFCN